MGDMTTALALLRRPGVDRRLACAHGKDAVDYAVQHGKLKLSEACRFRLRHLVSLCVV